jgi:hypothetical protein
MYIKTKPSDIEKVIQRRVTNEGILYSRGRRINRKENKPPFYVSLKIGLTL